MDIIDTFKSLLTRHHSDQQIVTALSSCSLQSGLQCAAVTTALPLQTPGWGRHRGDLEPSGPAICCSLRPSARQRAQNGQLIRAVFPGLVLAGELCSPILTSMCINIHNVLRRCTF